MKTVQYDKARLEALMRTEIAARAVFAGQLDGQEIPRSTLGLVGDFNARVRQLLSRSIAPRVQFVGLPF